MRGNTPGRLTRKGKGGWAGNGPKAPHDLFGGQDGGYEATTAGGGNASGPRLETKWGATAGKSADG